MSKKKSVFICTNCGYESLRWIGKCPNCEEWNSFTEEISVKSEKKKGSKPVKSEILVLKDLKDRSENRIKTNIDEFDRVLGGGLIQGSVILLGGDPGIGKSTLALQAAASINGKVLYVTGEESVNQINSRAKRLKLNSANLLVYAETDVDLVTDAIQKSSPDVVIIDSVQTIYRDEYENAAGTITQIRECTSYLMQIAKTRNFAVLLIGHVTKEGYLAGPKVLEHIVDTVLQLEGERSHSYRILRSQKNRYGSTNEIGIFEMHGEGLVEVKNPSAIFLSERENEISGSVVASSMEGTRPIFKNTL